jgi:3-isopropylmalate/(R)-2-methylmalate dehydratase small subunit
MKPFTTLRAVAVPLELRNVDTDAIIPARFLRWPRKDFGLAMFHDLRKDRAGTPTDFVLNDPTYHGARILVADDNFGCGSSREAAVWALAEHDGRVLAEGFRCVIAPSFGDIFFNNCSKNGVLPVRLTLEQCATLRAELRARPGAEIAVDLPDQHVTSPSGQVYAFDIDAPRKRCLVQGLDDIGLTEQYGDAISAYEAKLGRDRPWG